MFRVLCFFAMSALLARADGLSSGDKFDLSITGVELVGTALEIKFRIVNQSTGPVKIDLASEVVTVKAATGPSDPQTHNVSTRPEIYKARVTLITPANLPIFFPSSTARVFAPRVLPLGGELVLTKDVPLALAPFQKDIAKNPYRVVLDLAYRTDPAANCLSWGTSPTYVIATDAAGKLTLTPDVKAP